MPLQSVTPSDLAEQFHPPAGWTWGEFERVSPRAIRFGHVMPNGTPKGTLVYAPGLAEPVEKFFETTRLFLSKGFAVYTMDWFGQGGSGRYIGHNIHKRHAASFDEDIADFHHFISQHILTNENLKGLPRVLMGHSMGGNLALRYIQTHPDPFNCAILSAPMIGVFATRFLYEPFDTTVSSWLNSWVSEHYAIGGQDWNFERREKTKILLTSDKERGSIQNKWFRDNPALRCGDPTYGWVHQALKSCAAAKRAFRMTNTPLLIALAGRDALVDNHAAYKAIRELPDAQRLDLKKSKHEILMEKDDIRGEFLAHCFDFIVEKTDISL